TGGPDRPLDRQLLRRTISVLRAPAKDVQPREGAMVAAAGPSTRAAVAVYPAVAASWAARSASASFVLRAPKNSGVQAAFASIWTPHSASARVRAGLDGARHTRHPE